MNKILLKILVFLSLVLIPYTIEYKMNENALNKRLDAAILLLVHHIGSVYLYFGSLIFGFYSFHFVYTTIVVVFWIKGQFYCSITNAYNNMIKIKSRENFKDIPYYLKKITKIKYTQLLIAMGIMFYDIDRIFYQLTSNY
tara:strand:+ start:90 stop:509 length:420 start_codon:yes stop_codon:yes gene_type:complete